MGNWNIHIEGHGCHHNGKAEIDADLATREFVDKLLKQGHTLTSATFTITSQPEDLRPSPVEVK